MTMMTMRTPRSTRMGRKEVDSDDEGVVNDETSEEVWVDDTSDEDDAPVVDDSSVVETIPEEDWELGRMVDELSKDDSMDDSMLLLLCALAGARSARKPRPLRS